MNKQVDMQAFVGVDFDCEFFDDKCLVNIGSLAWFCERGFAMPEDGMSTYFVRPRLKKPQVLDDWSFAPVGLVWADRDGYKYNSEQVRSHGVNSCYDGVYSCIGAEPDYTEWANAHGVPVVEVSQ